MKYNSVEALHTLNSENILYWLICGVKYVTNQLKGFIRIFALAAAAAVLFLHHYQYCFPKLTCILSHMFRSLDVQHNY